MRNAMRRPTLPVFSLAPPSTPVIPQGYFLRGVPAKAGIQGFYPGDGLDSRLRGNDKETFGTFISFPKP
jgi:hypothetical protein